jgi:hypothetical protein
MQKENTRLAGQVPPDDNWDTYGFVGKRGAGKTHGGVSWAVSKALSDKENGVWLIVTTNQLLVTDIFDQTIPKLLPEGEVFSRNRIRSEIQLANGGTLRVVGQDYPLAGVYPSGAFLDNVDEWSEKNIKNVIFEIEKTPKAKIYWSSCSSPFVPEHFNIGRWVVYETQREDNPFLSEAFRKKADLMGV